MYHYTLPKTAILPQKKAKGNKKAQVYKGVSPFRGRAFGTRSAAQELTQLPQSLTQTKND